MKNIEVPQHDILEEIASSLIDISPSLASAALGITSPVEAIGSCISSAIKTPINIARNRKLYQFLKEVADGLNYLSKTTHNHGLVLEKILKKDNSFLEVFVNSAEIAMQQERKIQLLRNAVISTVTKIDIDHEQQLQFISYVRDLTTLQILLLKYFLEQESHMADIKCYKDLYQFFSEYIFQKSLIPVMDKDEFRASCSKLASYYLLNIPAQFSEMDIDYWVANSIEEYKELIRVTIIGKNFIRFVLSRPGDRDASLFK